MDNNQIIMNFQLYVNYFASNCDGRKTFIKRSPIKKRLQKSDENQYTVLYKNGYEFSLTRKVVFSEHSNKVYRI